MTPYGPEVFEAWCDMSFEGGGWTLLLRFDDDTEDLHYNDALWETQTLLNETALSPNTDIDGEAAKFSAYNWVVGDSLRLEFIEPVYNIYYDNLDARTPLEFFSGDGEAIVDTSAGCGDPLLSQTENWWDLMRFGLGSQFFGLNGYWSGSCGGFSCSLTRGIRFGYGASVDYSNKWEPLIGIGAYKFQSTTQGDVEELLPVVWQESNCGFYCSSGCQGDGLGYTVSDTSANLWLK
jgi:hypothetical protein